MALPIHSSFPVWAPRNSARYGTGTPTLAGPRFRKPKRLRSFGKIKSSVYRLAKSRWFRSEITVVWNRFMVLSNHGSFPVWGPRNSARYGKTRQNRKRRPVLGIAPGSDGPAKSRWFRGNFTAVWSRFTVLSIHGSFPVRAPRNSARYWTGTPTLAATRFRKPKRLRSFGKTT